MSIASFSNLFILACLWAPSAVCMKYIVNDFPPLTIVTFSSLLGCLILYPLAYRTGYRLHKLSTRTFKNHLVMSIFGSSLPYTLLCYSMFYMQSIWMGIITAMIPILTVILSHFWLPNEKITPVKCLGVLAGCTGALVLVFTTVNPQVETDNQMIIGVILALTATISYAIGIIYARKNLAYFPATHTTTTHLGISLLYLVPLMLLIDKPFSLQNPSLYAWLSLFVLAIPGTALAFIMYYNIMKCFGATVLAMVNYLLPVLKTALGVFILGETMGVEFCIAAALILAGLFLVSRDVQTRHDGVAV